MLTTSHSYVEAPRVQKLRNEGPLPESFQFQTRQPHNPVMQFQTHSGEGKLIDQDQYRQTQKHWDPLDTSKLDKRDVVYFEENKDQNNLKKINTSTWMYRNDAVVPDDKNLSSAKTGWNGLENVPDPYGPAQGEDAWKTTFYGNRQLGLGCSECLPSNNGTNGQYWQQQQGSFQDKRGTLTQTGRNAMQPMDIKQGESEAEIEGRWAAKAQTIIQTQVDEAKSKGKKDPKSLHTSSGWAQWANIPAPDKDTYYGPEKYQTQKDKNMGRAVKDLEVQQEWFEQNYPLNPTQAASKVLLTQGVHPHKNVGTSNLNQSWNQPSRQDDKTKLYQSSALVEQQLTRQPVQLDGPYQNTKYSQAQFSEFKKLDHANYPSQSDSQNPRFAKNSQLYGRISGQEGGDISKSNETNIQNPLFPQDRIDMYDTYKTANAEFARKEDLMARRE